MPTLRGMRLEIEGRALILKRKTSKLSLKLSVSNDYDRLMDLLELIYSTGEKATIRKTHG